MLDGVMSFIPGDLIAAYEWLVALEPAITISAIIAFASLLSAIHSRRSLKHEKKKFISSVNWDRRNKSLSYSMSNNERYRESYEALEDIFKDEYDQIKDGVQPIALSVIESRHK